MNKGQLFQSMAFSGTTPVLSEASLTSNIIPGIFRELMDEKNTELDY